MCQANCGVHDLSHYIVENGVIIPAIFVNILFCSVFNKLRMATYDEFNSGIILPSLVQNLKDILERYPDDNQIIKVRAHWNVHVLVHCVSYLCKFT